MSYVDEVYENVVAKNPNEPEFHQAVKEVLDSLRPVIDANEEKYRKEALLERIVEPERVIHMNFPLFFDCSRPAKYFLKISALMLLIL